MISEKWRESIPVIFDTYYSYFRNYNSQKPNILVVEGPTDKNFYYDIMGNAYVIDNGKTIRLKINKNCLFYNVFRDSKEDRAEQNLRSFFPYNIFRIQRMRHELKEDRHENKISNYSFVIEFVKQYENNIDRYDNVKCYGIIDNDFGHDKELEGTNNIYKPDYHDRETCLLRLLLPMYLDMLRCDKVKFIDKLSLILEACLKQGILEKSSHLLKDKGEFYFDGYIRATNSYFRGNERMLSLDFENYANNFYSGEYGNYNVIESELFDNGKDDFKRIYREVFEKVYISKDEIKKLLNKWLIYKNTSADDNKKLDNIFIYCNGHILIEQMLFCDKELFGFDNDRELIRILKNNILINKRKIKMLLDIPPLKEYVKNVVESSRETSR